MATRDDGNTDRMWDVELMCKLTGMLREDEFENLKEVIRMAFDIPQNVIEKCNTFTTFWTNLKKLGMIRVGEYGILVKYLELLHRKDCALVIRDYTTKIEGQMCQHGPSKQTDEPFEPRLLQKFEEMINSKLQEFHINQPTLPPSHVSGAVKPSPLSSNQTQTSQAPAMITKLDRLPTSPSRGAMGSALLLSHPAQTSQAATCVSRAPASASINQKDSNPAQAKQTSTCVRARAPASAKINEKYYCGETALYTASEIGDIGRVKVLLNKGADPDIQAEDGWTALMMASNRGHKEIAAVLLENNADVNVQNKDGVTALIYASVDRHKEVVAVLLENNADVNLQTQKGFTALIDASFNDHKEVVAVLLENKADVNLKTKDGQTALSLAKKKGHNEVAKMLMAAGAWQAYM